MAVSRVARGANGAVLGAVRYIVSMERADRQITYVVLVLIGIGVLILVLVTLSGIYFVRSIITPIRELNATAEKIAKGDFDVRVKKEKDDELTVRLHQRHGGRAWHSGKNEKRLHFLCFARAAHAADGY